MVIVCISPKYTTAAETPAKMEKPANTQRIFTEIRREFGQQSIVGGELESGRPGMSYFWGNKDMEMSHPLY